MMNWQNTSGLLATVLLAVGGIAARQAVAQNFQIVWVVVGEAEATAGTRPARVGKQLFMASELMTLSMQNVKVARLDVAPAVSTISVGQQLCVSSLNMVAYDSNGAALASAPLSISIRQDQKQKLALTRGKRDICVTPEDVGEYPIRFSSLLPARDGTTRGAQIFLRVGNKSANVAAAGKERMDESTQH